MDSHAHSALTTTTWSPRLPAWALSRGHDVSESDAAFAAGIALKSLDDLLRAEPPWLGCWRDRLALKSAAVAAKMVGRSEDENALRDAVLLTAAGDDPGPAGKLFLATRMVTRRSGTIGSPFVKELAALFGIRWDDSLASVPDLVDSAIQSGRAAPFVAADLIAAMCAARPDAELLALGLADVVLAHKLKWPKPVPLLLPERYGPAFHTIGGRGRVRPGEPTYPRAICLVLADGVQTALRSGVEIDRRTARLLAVAPKLRTKGAETIIRRLLGEDAVPASAARAVRPSLLPDFWIVTMAGSSAAKTRRQAKDRHQEVLYDRELEDLPTELRWREWMLRVEAVIFASAEPVARETLARVVGRDCSIDLIIDDLREELSSRPYELVSVAGGCSTGPDRGLAKPSGPPRRRQGEGPPRCRSSRRWC